MSAAADRLLKDVVDQPFKPLGARYDTLANAYQGNKAKTELVDKGLVVEREVRPKPVRRKLLELTDQGREYAETQLELDVERRGRGGIVHRFWQHRLKDVFEDAGWTAKRELFDADVYVNMDDVELAVEVAMGDNAREIDHVAEHLDAFDVVWVVCRNAEVQDGLQERLAEDDGLDERALFRPVRDICAADHTLLE